MKKPKTLINVVDQLIPRFKGLEHLFKDTEDNFASFCHSQLSGGIGMQIRNEFGLWTKDTDIYHYMVKEYGLIHADDMSDLILREVFRNYNKK